MLGLPVAYLMRFRVKRTTEYLILAAVIVSMLSSLLVRIYAWRMILGQNGLLNDAVQTLGLPDVGSLLFTRTAVILALVQLFLPYMILVTYAALRNIPHDYLDLASDLGANVITTWRRVLLPLLAPSLLAGVFFIFVGASSDWVAPAFLGGTSGAMVGVVIQDEFTTLGDYPQGAAVSLLLLLIFLAVYGCISLAFRRRAWGVAT
jgi:spermidine/putrescine transport system permease protein